MSARRRSIAVVAAVLTLAFAGRARAAEPVSQDESAPRGLRAEWTLNLASKYAFQGIDYSEGRPVWQPQGALAWGPLSATLWGNVNHDRRHLDEVDAGLQAAWALRGVSGDAGVLYLRYPNRPGWRATSELFLDAEREGAIATTLTVHQDVDEGDGTYATLGASHAFEAKPVTWTLGAKLHAQRHYYGMTGLPAAETSLGASFEWAGLAIEPTVTKLWTWDNGGFRGEARPAPDWMAGVSVSPK